VREMAFRALPPLAFFLLAGTLFAGSLLDELTPEQCAAVERGEQVFLSEPVEGQPWPKARVYQTVKASPIEVLSVFTDYAHAPAFVPSVLKCEVSKQIDPRTVEVDYLIDLPVVADEAYTVRNHMSSAPDGTLAVEWEMLRATTTLASKGGMRIQPYGQGSIICYANHVTPAGHLAALLRGPAMEKMRRTVQAIVDESLKERVVSPALLAAKVRRTEEALGIRPAHPSPTQTP